MSEASELTDLPADLRQLIEAERTAPISASRIDVRSRLAASVGGSPLGHAAGASLAGGTGAKVLAIFALVVGIGTVVTLSHSTTAPTPPTPPTAPTTARATVQAPRPVGGSTPSEHAVEHALPGRPSRARAASPMPPPRVVASAASAPVAAPDATSPPILVPPAPELPPVEPSPLAVVPTEAELLHRAWDARERDPASALALVVEDDQLHPAGALAEERDALRISALAALGRRADARLAATQFFVRYPDSIHRAMIESSIGAPTVSPQESP